MVSKNNMNLQKCFIEEDLFPREITTYEERDFGILFYNEKNKDSYDSNHAIIFRDKISDLDAVLEEIIRFYTEKGIRPNLYQSICDEGYFTAIEAKLTAHGFEVWTEEQRYMILSAENQIIPNPKIVVQRTFEWREEYGTEIFEKADEPWEIDVAKRALQNTNTLFFVAFYNGKPVGMTHCHVTDGVCRVDYLLVSKECRNMGVGRALINCFVEYCHQEQITNCYLWPDGETAEKIYHEAGFRHIATKQAGRASYHAWDR